MIYTAVTGANANANVFNCDADTRKIIKPTPIMANTSLLFYSPCGIWGFWVRGFRESSLAFINRLADMAKVLAPNIAAVIHINNSNPGQDWLAKIIPMYANGSANKDSHILIDDE